MTAARRKPIKSAARSQARAGFNISAAQARVNLAARDRKLSRTEIARAKKDGDTMVAFAMRHRVSIDWLILGDTRGVSRDGKVGEMAPFSFGGSGGDLFRDPGVSKTTGKRNDNLNDELAALPFVESRKGGRCWWAVRPSGDYTVDYGQGQAWAKMVLPFLKYNFGLTILGHITLGMIESGEPKERGLVLGFMRELADQLGTARANLAMAVAATDSDAPADVRNFWNNIRRTVSANLNGAL